MTNFYRDRVLSGREDVRRIFESKRFLAFEHTNPSYPVHIVVIPKAEIDSLLDLPLDPSLLSEMIGLLQKAAADVTRQHGKCRVVTNLGQYQETKHLHWHIIAGDRLSSGAECTE